MKPQKLVLPNTTLAEHRQMLESVKDELPTGDCDKCGGKNVKVFPLTNCDEPSRKMSICFDCMTGVTDGVEIIAAENPANN